MATCKADAQRESATHGTYGLSGLLLLMAMTVSAETTVFQTGTNESVGQYVRINDQGQIAFYLNSLQCRGGVYRNDQPYACGSSDGWRATTNIPLSIGADGTIYFPSTGFRVNEQDHHAILKGPNPGERDSASGTWSGDTVDAIPANSLFYRHVASNSTGYVAWQQSDAINKVRPPQELPVSLPSLGRGVTITDDLVTIFQSGDQIIAYDNIFESQISGYVVNQDGPGLEPRVLFGPEQFGFQTSYANIEDFDVNANGEVAVLVEYEGEDAAGDDIEFYEVVRVSTEGDVMRIANTRDDTLIEYLSVRIADNGTIGIGQSRFRLDNGGLSMGRAIYTTQDLSRPMIAEGHLLNDGLTIVGLDNDQFDISSAGVAALLKVVSGQTRDRVVRLNSPLDFPPPDTNARFWSNAQGGNFGDASNWEPDEVPGSTEAAIFDLDASLYTVTAAGQSAGRMIVDRGNVQIRGPLELTSNSAAAPSLHLRNDDSGTGFLQLASSALLNTKYVAVDAGSSLDVNSGGQLVNEQSVLVGGMQSGSTRFTVDNGGKVSAEDLTVSGAQGNTTSFSASGTGSEVRIENRIMLAAQNTQTGELEISSGARLRSQTENTGPIIFMADAAGSAAKLTVKDEGTRVDAHSLVLGSNGSAQAQIMDGAELILHVGLFLCVNPGASGTLTVSGSDSNGAPTLLDARGLGLDSGANSGGCVVSIDGGRMMPTNIFLRARPGSSNLLSVVNNGIVDGVDALQVQSNGRVALNTGALLQSVSGELRAGDGSRAELRLADWSEWSVTNDISVGDPNATTNDPLTGGLILINNSTVAANRLILHPDGRLEGNGTVEADLLAEPGSYIATSVTLQSSPPEVPAKHAKGSSTDLVVTGNFTANGAIVELGITGDSASDTARLLVSGDLEFDNSGILRLRFAPGYAPVADQQYTMIVADGTLDIDVGEPPRLQYAGLEEGFRYDVEMDANGNLVIEAKNDGTPYAADTLFRNGFDGEFMDSPVAR